MLGKKVKKTFTIILYLTSSLITITINKYLLSILHMKSQFIFLALQSFTVSLLCLLFYLVGLVKIKGNNLIYYFPLSFLLTGMIYTSSKTLEYLSISLFTLFKNITIVLVALVEWYTLKRYIDLKSWLAFFLMFFSSYVGDKQEFSFNAKGYIFMAANVLLTTCYVIFLKYILDKGVNNTDPVFFGNLLSVPQLLIFSYFFENLYFDYKNLKIVNLIFFSGISAFFTSFTTCNCLKIFSSTTLSMLGAVNKLLMSFAGIVFIGEDNVGVMKVCSLLLGCISGFFYSYRIKKE